MTATKLRIRIYGDPCLRKRSKPVKEVGPAERMLIQSMIATMHEHKGIGLAAPQVGINEQILVADIGDGPIAVINPRILKKSGQEILEEGCLSIPEVMVKVKRSKKITVSFLNEKNERVKMNFEDLLARVIQHETDHLRGRLITDYASWTQKFKLTPTLKKIQKGVSL